MKSGENGLIGPGSNDYGRKDSEEKSEIDEAKVIHTLTPELADKIYKSVCKANYDNKVSKDKVLHHLKQLKAQMGKLKSKDERWMHVESAYNAAVTKCMEVIDKKIEKVNKL